MMKKIAEKLVEVFARAHNNCNLTKEHIYHIGRRRKSKPKSLGIIGNIHSSVLNVSLHVVFILNELK